VGIGTTTPTGKLDVRATTTDTDALITAGNSDRSHFVTIFPGRLNDPNPFIMWKGTDPLRFATDNAGFTEVMRINSNGKVGIGRIAITDMLEVNGTAGKTAGGNTWAVISDARLKDKVADFEYGLNAGSEEGDGGMGK